MQTVTIESDITGWQAGDVYERLKDPAVYLRCAPEQVKSITSEPSQAPGEAITRWEIYFRNGLLRWSERDLYDDANMTLRFRQIAGDFDIFEGDWVIAPSGSDAVTLTFTATFDFGVPSLESVIDPVAIRVLRRAMGRIIGSLYGGTIRDEQQPARA